MKPPGREGRPWALSQLRDSSTDTAPGPWVQGTHPATPSLKGSLEFSSQPWNSAHSPGKLSGTCRAGCRTKAHVGLRAEVLVGMFLSHLRAHLVAQQPQDSRARGPHSHTEKQLPSGSHGTTAALGDWPGQLLWPQGYLS